MRLAADKQCIMLLRPCPYEVSMPDRMPPAGWLRSFEAAARHAGFAAAAHELGLTPAAVSQQIRALESRLGFALFERLPRGVRLTALGQAYLPAVRRAFEDLAAATAGLFGNLDDRPLIVRAPPSFGVLCLAPLIPAFRARHPEIAIRLCSSVWSDAVDEDLVDVDVRYGRGRWPAQEAVRLTEPVSVPVLPPEADLGDDPVAVTLALAETAAIHITGCENLWPAFADRMGVETGRIAPRLSADTSLAALEMVAAGAGCALVARELTVPYGRRLTVAGALAFPHGEAHHLLLPNRARAAAPAALLFRGWLLEHFGGGGA